MSYEELKKQHDDLLAALESIVSLDLCCATREEKRKADTIFAAARAAIAKAKPRDTERERGNPFHEGYTHEQFKAALGGEE